MSTKMFKGPRLKIKRANKHIADLNDAINAFVQTDFYALSIEPDGNSGLNFLKFRQTQKTPCEFALIIGDAIHNLRSALDLTHCETVTRVGGTVTDWTRFAFFKDRQELVSKLGKGVLKTAPDIVDFIADVIEPYDTGNNPLSALHALDITDKHLLLLPVFSVAAIRGDFKIFSEKAPTPRYMRNVTFGVGEGGVLKILGMPGKFDIEGDFQPSFDITFGQGQALEGEPIIPTLHQLAQLVSNIVDKFENRLLTRA
ncbi:MAG TPA: hypothetical protein VGE08_09545 [Steroidobacter sp.]|uniref:hypothetical protein n=1 Tax=Steroidobacter sp. TaxID=1978227 RepID=UPI002ED9F52F